MVLNYWILTISVYTMAGAACKQMDVLITVDRPVSIWLLQHLWAGLRTYPGMPAFRPYLYWKSEGRYGLKAGTP